MINTENVSGKPGEVLVRLPAVVPLRFGGPADVGGEGHLNGVGEALNGLQPVGHANICDQWWVPDPRSTAWFGPA